MKTMKFVKVMSTAAMVAALLVVSAVPAFAGSWNQDGSQWKYQNDNGSYAIGWQWVDGKCYYFDNNGVMAAGTTTPDGYTVDNSGAWTVNGVVQTQNTGTADTSNPLDLSHLQKWIVMEPAQNPAVWSGNVDTRVVPQWINSDQYLMNHPELTNDGDADAYSLQKAVSEKNPRYAFAATSDGTANMSALAELAGFPRAVTEVRGERVDAIKNAITEFLNSFPNWKTASDFEKAVRVCEWINEKMVYEDGQPDNPYAYGALVNGKANCSGLTNAAEVLSWAIDLPVATISPQYAAHVLPVFYVNGVWLSKEMTNDSTSFDICNVYEDNGYGSYQLLGKYCEGVGYQIPSVEQVKAAFPGLTSNALIKGEQGVTVRFH